MYVLLIFFALLFSAGSYFVLADVLGLPTLAATKAVLKSAGMKLIFLKVR